MVVHTGDGITYSAELFRIAGSTYQRLYREGHGYIVIKINNELVYVFNGVRVCLVHIDDIVINHNSR